MTKAQEPTIGRIVHYTLSESDAEAINRRRLDPALIPKRMTRQEWHQGAQAHVGNVAHAGDVVPLTIVRVWHEGGEYKPGESVLNGQAALDGTDTLWVTSAHEGEGEGEWHWPPRV